MNNRHPTLLEILQPQFFQDNPERAKVTRTVLQPEVDEFEFRAACADTGAPQARASMAFAVWSRSAARAARVAQMPP